MKRVHTTARKANRLNLWWYYQTRAYSMSVAEKQAIRNTKSQDFLDKDEMGIINALSSLRNKRKPQAK